MEKDNNFVSYDYTQITVDKNMESIYIDTYENFGWELTESQLNAKSGQTLNNRTLYFRRNRKINNKNELNKLQRKVDICFSNIKNLEKKKNSSAMITSFSIGFLAIVFISLSVFAITGYLNVNIVFSTILGIIGIGLCIPPYFVYKDISKKKSNEIEPLIDKAYDNLSDICEEAHNLIYSKS